MSTSRQPKKDAQYVAWIRARYTQWSGTQGVPPVIGVTSAQLDALEPLIQEVETKFAAMMAARASAKSRTYETRQAIKACRKAFSSLISMIDGFARNTNNPAVYTMAGISPPSPRTPRDTAAMAESVATKVRTDGSITFSFKVRSGGGATYEIQRQDVSLAGEVGPWGYLATVGKKKFLDPSVPYGLRAVSYRVRTTLSNGVSSEWSEPSTSNFGNTGSAGGPMAAKKEDKQDGKKDAA